MTHVRQDLAVRPFKDEDEAAVVDLLNRSLGGGPGGTRPPEFFRWKHVANPFGPSFMLVAEAKGRVVGLRAFMRWRFNAGDRTIKAVRAVDTATHPDHQRKGIFARLTQEALGILHGQADLVFNTPNEKSLPGYLKMGWRVVDTVRPSVRIRRPMKFMLGVRSLRAFGEGGAGEPPAVDAASAAEAFRDEARLARLLSSAQAGGDGRLRTPRDIGYLRWRYAEAPLLDYRAVSTERAGSLRGLAVFRVRPRGTLWEVSVVELIVPSGDVPTAGRLLKEVARSAAVDHVTCSFPEGSTAARAARRHGFIRAPSGATLVVHPLGGGTRPDPLRLESWALSLGDLEVF